MCCWSTKPMNIPWMVRWYRPTQILVISNIARILCVFLGMQAINTATGRLKHIFTKKNDALHKNAMVSYNYRMLFKDFHHLIGFLHRRRNSQHYSDVIWTSWRLRSQAPRLLLNGLLTTRKTIKYIRSILLALCAGNPAFIGWYPWKWPAIHKAFPCFQVTMITKTQSMGKKAHV